MKLMLVAPGTRRLKLKYNRKLPILLSNQLAPLQRGKPVPRNQPPPHRRFRRRFADHFTADFTADFAADFTADFTVNFDHVPRGGVVQVDPCS